MKLGGFRAAGGAGPQLGAVMEVALGGGLVGLKTYLFFADLRGAFDTVGHQAMVRKLRMAGLRGVSLRFFTALYRTPRIGARLACGITDFHQYLRGVLQGCPGPPLAFIVFINDALDALEKGGKVGVGAPGARLKEEDVGGGALVLFLGLLFADDTVTAAADLAQLERVLLLVEGWCTAWDLDFGAAKCGLMVVSPDGVDMCERAGAEEEWTVDMQELLSKSLKVKDQVIPVVTDYEYLGFLVEYTLDLGPGIAARARAVKKRRNALRRFLGSPSIPVGVRIAVLNAMVAPVAYYAGEILGMATTSKGAASVKPIVREFNLAVDLVVRASWSDSKRKADAMPLTLNGIVLRATVTSRTKKGRYLLAIEGGVPSKGGYVERDDLALVERRGLSAAVVKRLQRLTLNQASAFTA